MYADWNEKGIQISNILHRIPSTLYFKGSLLQIIFFFYSLNTLQRVLNLSSIIIESALDKMGMEPNTIFNITLCTTEARFIPEKVLAVPLQNTL